MKQHRSLFFGLFTTAILLPSFVACSSPPPPKPVAKPEPARTSTAKREPLPAMEGEVGSVDERKANSTFTGLADKLDRCINDRRKQVEKLDFIAGHVAVTVILNRDGSVKNALLPENQIGDLAVEKCMISAIKAAPWPQVQGGREGRASNSYDFPQKAARDPVAWEDSKVSKEIDGAKSKLSACTKGKSGYQVTAYVDTDGSVLSAGSNYPADGAETAAECLVKEVKALKFSSPGGYPSKVTFAIP